MRPVIFILLFMALCTYPATLTAQAFEITGEQQLHFSDEITRILDQIASLQSLIKTLESSEPKRAVLGAYFSRDHQFDIDQTSLFRSSFYSGRYEAVYETNGTALVAPQDERVRTLDANLWEHVRDVFGQNAIATYLDEFRVYSDKNARYDAFIELKPNGKWLLGVNAEDLDLSHPRVRESVTELLIHEYAHILIHYRNDMENRFNFFWNENDHAHARVLESMSDTDRRYDEMEEYYEKNSNRFVSDYATTNAEEDFAESFLQFVINDIPESGTLKEKKVMFFYAYPEFIEIRNDIRNRLIP